MILIYDTETTGLPRDWNAPITDSDNWPRLVQLAWQLHDPQGKLLSRGNRIVQPDGFTIPFNSTKIHGITTARAQEEGLPLDQVMEEFMADAAQATYVMGHNIGFDVNVAGAELVRLGQAPEGLTEKALIDSKDEGTEFCAIPGGRGGKFKWPTLTELHQKLFGEGFGDAHDAAYDVSATARCFFEMVRLKVIERPEFEHPEKVVYEAPKLEAANFEAPEKASAMEAGPTKTASGDASALEDVPFTHLHVHSQFSVLQAVSPVGELVVAAKEMGMPALAVTDHGNMMAAFQFVRACNKEGIKPIVGAELNVCKDMHDKSKKDDGYPTVFLAKNKNGYHNLAKVGVQGLHGWLLLRATNRPGPRGGIQGRPCGVDRWPVRGGAFFGAQRGRESSGRGFCVVERPDGRRFLCRTESARPGGGVCGQRLSPADGRKA